MGRSLQGVSTTSGSDVDGARCRRRRQSSRAVVVVVVPVPGGRGGGGVLVTRTRSSLQQRGVPVLPRRGEDAVLGGLYLLRQRLLDHRAQRGDLVRRRTTRALASHCLSLALFSSLCLRFRGNFSHIRADSIDICKKKREKKPIY